MRAGPGDVDYLVVISVTGSDTEMHKGNCFLQHRQARKPGPALVFMPCLMSMLPDILCKCKAGCTFIRFVHRVRSLQRVTDFDSTESDGGHAHRT